MNEKTTVEMTVEEKAQFEAFRKEQERKTAEANRKADREAYSQLVDETIEMDMPILYKMSKSIADVKQSVMEDFREALRIKSDLFGQKVEEQRSHTFTNTAGDKRIMLGVYCLDAYRDTVNDGIAMVRTYIESLAKDADSKALVNAVLRLMSRDQAGNLKASRVLQLRKMAQESGNEDFLEGVRIIEESYQPLVSKQFIRAEIKGTNGEWVSVPLGMTEA